MGKLIHDTNHIGQLGISWLRWMVEGQWGCGLEVVSAHNDNSLDVLILLKRRDGNVYSGPTGDVVFAQVKTGYVKKNPTASYSISLGSSHIEDHRSRWRSYPGPVIMISVIPPRHTQDVPRVFWANLRDEKSFNGSGSVRFDIARELKGLDGKADIFNLCWRWAEFRRLPQVEAPRVLSWSKCLPGSSFTTKQCIHEQSRAFYSDWMKHAQKDTSAFGGVRITNRGWRHMTRISRSKARMLQSLLLLPAASEILAASGTITPRRLTSPTKVTLPNGNVRERSYEGITSRVTFYERQEATVRVVLERNIVHSVAGVLVSNDATLYSVYEVARRRSGF